MSSSSSSRSGDRPQSGGHQSVIKKRAGPPHKRCNDPDHEDPLKRGCGRMPTEETAKECTRCAKKLTNREDKQRSRSRNPRTKKGSSSEDTAKSKTTDGAQLVNQARELAANALYQLSGCDHCSPILRQLDADLSDLLGDLIEPDPRGDDAIVDDTAGGSLSSSSISEPALSGGQIATTTEIYLPQQQLYSAATSTVQGQFGVYPPPRSTRLLHYVSPASTGDAAQTIAPLNREHAAIRNYVPPLHTQLLAVDTTLAVDVTNAFDDGGLHPLNFFSGYQLRINEVFQKAGSDELPGDLPSDSSRDPSGPAGDDYLSVVALYRMYYDALMSKMRLIRTRADDRYHFIEEAVMKKGPVVRENGWWELNPHIVDALWAGLFPNHQGQRLGVEAFVRLFQRTSDRRPRYVDSRICADAFEERLLSSSTEIPWFSD